MKKNPLYFSLVSNVALLGVATGHWLGWMTLPTRLFPKLNSLAVDIDAKPKTSIKPLEPSVGADRPATFVWSSLESADYREYIQNLRSIGCPEETIADIVVADIRKQFSRQRAQLHKTMSFSVSLSSQLALLDQQENHALECLLGQNWRFSLPETIADADQRFPGQSQETVRQILDMEQKFNDQTEAIYAQSPASLTEEDRETLRRLRQEKEDGIVSLLGQQGYEDYLINSSGSVQSLRQSPWFSFKDDQEFRAIAALQVQWDRSMDSSDSSADGGNLQKQAEQNFQSALKTTLGDERFAEFQRSRDYRYQQIASLTTRYGLQEGTAAQVFAIRQNLDAQLIQPVSADAPAIDATSLRQQSQEQIRGLLGDAAFASYNQNLPE